MGQQASGEKPDLSRQDAAVKWMKETSQPRFSGC